MIKYQGQFSVNNCKDYGIIREKIFKIEKMKVLDYCEKIFLTGQIYFKTDFKNGDV